MQFNAGPFGAHIVAKRPDTEDVILFENESGDTDHNHLGQVISYASGLKAGVILCLAERFREEHRTALGCLNENGKGLSFIGLELKAVRLPAEPNGFRST